MFIHVKLTTQQCCQLLITGNVQEYMVTPLNFIHYPWWLAALLSVYSLAKQINHSAGSQNTPQHSFNGCISLLVALFPLLFLLTKKYSKFLLPIQALVSYFHLCFTCAQAIQLYVPVFLVALQFSFCIIMQTPVLFIEAIQC